MANAAVGEVIMIATTVMIIPSMTPNILNTRVLLWQMHKSEPVDERQLSLRISFNGSKDLASSGSN